MICIKNTFIFASAKANGTLAQLVEQRTENPCVPGSIPGGTTKNIRNEAVNQLITDFLFLKSYTANIICSGVYYSLKFSYP